MSAAPTVHIPHLDGWRGLAIVAVLVGHFAGKGFTWMGPFGVALFFVLSGRLMGQLLFVKEVALPTFFFRRASRILPAFWLFVVAMYVYAAWLQPVPYHAGAAELASTLVFLRTYLPDAPSIFTRDWPIGHLWSLNVEEHSYLFLGLGALVCRRLKRDAVTAAFLIGSVLIVIALNMLYRHAPPSGPAPWHIRSETASLGILLGATLWFLRERIGPAWMARVPAPVPILTFVIATLCAWKYPVYNLDKVLLPICLAVSVVFIDRFPAAVLAVLSSQPLRWFGLCSFSLYLWQQAPFVALLKGEISPLPALAIALVAGSASYYGFENPLRIAINASWERYKASRQPALHHA